MKFSFFKKHRQIPKKPIQKIIVSVNPLIIKTYNPQPTTYNLQPTTHNLQPTTYNLKPTTHNLKKGFTLVELMVSVAITGILMIGISTFFSSTFSAMFRAQNRAGSTARQFAVNEIVRDKFTTIETLVDYGADWMLSINKNTKNQLPFSYIGKNTENNLVFKDLFVFNKIVDPGGNGSHLFGDSGTGHIREAAKGTSSTATSIKNLEIKNFAGFAKVGDNYYLAMPNKNKIIKCDPTCDPIGMAFTTELRSPTDIEIDDAEEYLYISDSENGRIIKYKIDDGTVSSIAQPVKYPTGLAYYNDGITEWLFFSETFSHKVKKINLSNSSITTVAGDGDNEECNNITAKFCKLNMPTGLFINREGTELYIADSGNNRVLKMSDPGVPESLKFEFTPGNNYALDRIQIINDNWTGGEYNESVSNLIGNKDDYSSDTKTFLNPNRLTTFTNDECESNTSSFYINERYNDIGLATNDKLIINGNIYTIHSIDSGQECKESDDDPSMQKDKINVNENTSEITTGQTVYLSNQTNVVIQIDSKTDFPENEIEITNNGDAGFQNFEIKTYDVSQGLVSTKKNTERIGDGKVGTDEDTIEVISGLSLNFPTGVSSAYVANSGGKKVIKISDSTKVNLVPIDENFTTFDYISDFELATEDSEGNSLDPLIFETLNSDKILELTLNAKVDDETIQTYKLNAAIPTP